MFTSHYGMFRRLFADRHLVDRQACDGLSPTRWNAKRTKYKWHSANLSGAVQKSSGAVQKSSGGRRTLSLLCATWLLHCATCVCAATWVCTVPLIGWPIGDITPKGQTTSGAVQTQVAAQTQVAQCKSQVAQCKLKVRLPPLDFCTAPLVFVPPLEFALCHL